MKIFDYNNRHINDKSDDLLRFVVEKNNIDDLKNFPKVKQLHITNLKQNNFEYLLLIFTKILDDDITPLFKLTKLKQLRLTEETYNTETYAALAAKLPNVQCECFKGYIVEDNPIDGKDIRIVGKRKPTLNKIKDRDKIEKYLKEFEILKNKYL